MGQHRNDMEEAQKRHRLALDDEKKNSIQARRAADENAEALRVAREELKQLCIDQQSAAERTQRVRVELQAEHRRGLDDLHEKKTREIDMARRHFEHERELWEERVKHAESSAKRAQE